MDLEELKRILQKDKGKIIIVENGKPLMIILPYENPTEEEGLSGEPPEVFEEPKGLEPELGELTIDDLPL
ncbi:MAG: hypothetical protein A3D64_01100 [Candidatus Wildermuthbacteria bacterium RIFCSPHIGHO2_02_FULL_49_9]|uniref:Prevent-host-death protein n=2 Tax=Candidatus Wildermuthiibacteriota TaxID=1817923 RepID=A0A1G2QXK7_9BACT|nr:MAG: hypothetical protein A2672_01700 [Candidatus Wildermuthbacteria bacterium RIFCSPHIGHO2_01_FULL_49_22b]OHA70459.1 MAG: hypothetical protein A3D64_01100 [Candidatus Wildermuthbacteria bacterium RIFCSPHIGHO2_02_FULL_49_9]